MTTISRPRGSPLWRAEAGFTIVESIVGLVLFVVLFATAATTLQITGRQQRELRARQQATAIADQQLEEARSHVWTALEMTTAPDASDTNVSGGLLLAAPFGLPSDELLVIDPGVYTATDPDPGLVATENAAAETLDALAFDLRQYVTEPTAGLRRIVVVVTWELNGLQRDYVATTQIAEIAK